MIKRRKTIIIGIVILILNCSGYAFSLDGWETSITVSILNAENRLSFGQRAYATDNFDGLYDVPAMLNGDIKVCFTGQSGNYWRDIKRISDGERKVWNIRIESRLKGELVTIRWNRQSLPEERDIYLIDEHSKIITDMKLNSNYSFKYDGLKELRIENFLFSPIGADRDDG